MRLLLRQRHQIRKDAPDDFSIENPADVLSAREGAARTFGYLLIAVASVSLVVGGISIMNIMLVSVTERTREIGLRMAVGARRRDIRSQFLIEAVTLALVGGLGGGLAGSLGALADRLAGGVAGRDQPNSDRSRLRLCCADRGRIWLVSCLARLTARSDGGAAIRVNERRRAHVENEWAALRATHCSSVRQLRAGSPADCRIRANC